MELIAGSFLLVGLALFGHIGVVIASYLQRPWMGKPAVGGRLNR
jgi:hypothetical protein